MSEHDEPPWMRSSSAFKLTTRGPTFYDFTTNSIVVVRAHPTRAWQKSNTRKERRWFTLRDPDIDIASLVRSVRTADSPSVLQMPAGGSPPVKRSYQERRRDNFRAFLEHVPVDVQDLIADGWAGPTWSYFRLLMTSPLARELAHSPGGDVFVWMMSRAHDLLPHGMKRVSRWVEARLSQKRKVVMGELGLPASSSTMSLLAKVPRAELHGGTLPALIDALSTPATAMRVRHAARLPAALLKVLVPHALPHLSPSLLRELEHSEHRGPFSGPERFVLDTIRLAQQENERLGVLTSLAQARAEHDRLVQLAWRDSPFAWDAAAPVALPPLPVTLTEAEAETAHHLSTSAALVKEGQTMRHCLGSLSWHRMLASAGRFFAFALMKPVRATVAFYMPEGARTWEVYDLKGKANSPPCAEHQAFTEVLLRRFRTVEVETPTREIPIIAF